MLFGAKTNFAQKYQDLIKVVLALIFCFFVKMLAANIIMCHLKIMMLNSLSLTSNCITRVNLSSSVT